MTQRERLDHAAEQALLEQCRRQNLEAFGKIVDAYQARVVGFIRRMVGTSEEAEDLAQEVFVRAFQSVSRFDGRSSLRTWLFRIAYNLCVDHSRRKQRTPQGVSLVDSDDEEFIDVPDGRWNPEAVVMNDELVEVVENAILSMSEKLRTVLLLHDKEEMGYEEIAQLLGVPVGTVKSRLFLARQFVIKVVQEYQS